MAQKKKGIPTPGKSRAFMGHVQAPQGILELSQHSHTGSRCVLFAPVSFIALFLRIKFKWNPSMLLGEEECDVAGHKVCCVSERSLGAVRMRMGWEFQRCLLLVGMAEHSDFAVAQVCNSSWLGCVQKSKIIPRKGQLCVCTEGK